ncbi:PDZ and LIM domain protein Zasp isoform X3 [Teleopsis dalmanni]|uniref:PDZ and LIM domain protein Zasp isoform X3 n=1 Tax=Teleopsis dalmanni TaxID=139649 RepID=UPI0018CE435B|nr:PDZ and LIM domain protein Zasp isoform X3 [Teleopsis dalmanni]
MAQPQLMQIKLSRFDAQPWGFRLQGGVDFAAPLLVQKVNGGSLAEQAGLLPGDAVLKINDVDVFNLRHKDAQDIVVRSGNNFVVTVQRGGSTWRPHVTPTGHVPQPNQNSPYLQTVTKTSLAHKQQESQHIGCGYNNAARPFVNGGDGSVKSIVNKQYNTPVGIYSDESIAETLSAQAEVLAGGVLGVNFKKNEKEYQADKSEVLKFLREEETGQSTPEPHSPANFYWTHSHAIGGNERRSTRETVQQEQVQKTTEKRVSTSLVQSKVASSSTATTVSASNVSSAAAVAPATVATPSEKPDPRIIMMPVCPALQGPEYKAEMEAAAAALAHDDGQRPLSASGHPACQLCGVGIVGVFVRIKDKNLHVECFKCATCGTSLKNQGYYNFNNKLYCDIHAKLAAMQNPPAGTEGYVPVPIKPNTKLSATTISSALNAHGFNGVSNGSSTPTPAPAPAPVANPLATTAANTVAQAPIAEIIKQDNTTANMAATFENNDQSIYGQINTNAANIAQPSFSASGDQPFEYVTLTGNVIRSVVPPGKGGSINYKVNQGYARPFGAAPPSAAPKSPISYPPQPQQWASPPQQQAPKPASNPYATLPRSNVGQQEPCLQTNTLNATLPRKINAANVADHHDNAVAEPIYNDEATAMLTESIGKINMGEKMNNFMAEAGKIISNMLEARLANNSGHPSLSNSGSTLSLRSNSSSNLSKSPMVMRKRFELDDFKDIDPTEPVSLKPVVAMAPVTQSPALHKPKAQPQMPKSIGSLTTDMPVNHPMGKVLDICDNGIPNKREVINSAAKPAGGVVNIINGNANQLPPPPPPMPVSTATRTEHKIEANNSPLPPTEVVVFRNNTEQNNKRTGRGGELSTHAMDRRSYIEPNAQNESIMDGPAFSISVKALGGPKDNDNPTMSPENEEVVSQLLKDGKRPICCQCNNEIKKGPFITALGRIWCPEHFICVNANCRRPLQDIGFVEEKGDLYCEYCFEKYLAPTCSKCCTKIKGDCLNAIGKHFHPECFTCGHCGKLFGNTPFFLEDGNAYCEADWNELFTTKCFACGFPVEAGDRWVEALNHNYHSQCFNCSYCKQNLEGQSFYNKGGRPFCKNHAR